MMTDRQTRILTLLLQRGETAASVLAQALGASAATTRRDLAALEEAGQIERGHGTARIAVAHQHEAAFAAREQQNVAAKRAIAGAAAGLLRPGGTVFLDAGTTVLHLARHMRINACPAVVFTNGLVLAQEMSADPDREVHLLGGRLRGANQSIVGPDAQAMLGRLWVDQLFLGVSGLDLEGRLSSHDPEEAALNAAMTDRAAEIVVLADAAKLGLRATHEVAWLAALAAAARPVTLVTDAPPPAPLAKLLAQAGATLRIAEKDPTP